MDYENMSDFEINKAVSEFIYQDCIELEVFQHPHRQSVAEVVSQGVYITSFDFNNPSDAWPIIEQVWRTLMSVTNYDYGVGVGESKTTIWDARMHMHGDSKLRAACIVYLMTQEAQCSDNQ